MGSLALLFIGSVLVLNGLSLLQIIGPQATAPINLFVGLFTLGVALQAVLPASSAGTPSIFVGAAGFLLFAFTYLYVAMNNFFDMPGGGLGWYCGWSVLGSSLLAVVNFATPDGARAGWLWISWAGLFAAFFVIAALDKVRWVRPTGVYAILHGFFSTGIPGAMQLTGHWNSVPVWVVAATQMLIAAVFLALGLTSRHTAVESTAAIEIERRTRVNPST